MMIRIFSLFRTAASVALFSVAWLTTSATVVSANALLEFSETLRSFSANFTQTVYDADSVVLQESTGVVLLARPGRFKWTYDAPINQIIVADGLTLWVYDEEIKQVTKQPQSTTLGSAPIGLLSGQRDIQSEFVVTELGEKDDLEWFQLQPLVSDTDFNEIFLALNNDGLHAMELRDNFDQATQIVFSGFRKNISVDSEQFNFVVPEGVDVVGEGGVPETQDELLQDDLLSEESPVSTDNIPERSAEPGSTEPDNPLVQPTNPVILPADDIDPLLDDISTTELQDVLQPVGSEETGEVGSTLVDRNLNDTGTEAPSVGETSPGVTDTNSDEDLLSGELPAEPAESSVQPETEQAPLIDTADPAREITFEEQKVTE